MFLGRISFSLYLVHYTPLAVMEWLFDNGALPNKTGAVLASIVAYAATVLLLSVILHYAVLCSGAALPASGSQLG